MKTLYVTDLKANDTLTAETFAVQEVKMARDKNERPYYDLILVDKTGSIKAKIWSDYIDSIEKQALKPGKIVAVDAHVDSFRNQLQITITGLRGVDENKVEDYMETSIMSADEMWKDLQKVVKSVKNEYVQKLLHNMLNDDWVSERLKVWPAALSIHHNFRSGLLQHILEMLTVAEGMEKYYPNADFDLVKAGIILHDIGKLEELDGSGMVVSYTRKGSLIGHIVLGLQMVNAHMPEDMPTNLITHIQHIILSHHGVLEYGSPVVPSTLEAILVYRIDNVSADARKADKALQEEGDEQGLTSYNKYLGTRMWNGN